MLFCRQREVKPMEDIIEFIGTLLAIAIGLTFDVLAIIAYPNLPGKA